MTSGFCFDDDNLLYIVNTGFYDTSDDKSCFRLSCMYHSMIDKVLDDNYKIMRADVVLQEDCNVSINFNENGKEEFRVYKVKDK